MHVNSLKSAYKVGKPVKNRRTKILKWYCSWNNRHKKSSFKLKEAKFPKVRHRSKRRGLKSFDQKLRCCRNQISLIKEKKLMYHLNLLNWSRLKSATRYTSSMVSEIRNQNLAYKNINQIKIKTLKHSHRVQKNYEKK